MSKFFLFLSAVSLLLLSSCASDAPTVPPISTVPTADLLARKWLFNEQTVKTDAKSYVIPLATMKVGDASFYLTIGNYFGDNDGSVTFKSDKTFSFVSLGSTVAGTWALSGSDKKLAMVYVNDPGTTGPASSTINFTVNSISSTAIDLASTVVNLSKTTTTDEEEKLVGVSSLLMLKLDKKAGGTIDFNTEPKPKTLQLTLKGKAQ